MATQLVVAPLNPTLAEVMLGMQTFIHASGSASTMHGKIRCVLLFGGTNIALIGYHYVAPVDQKGIEMGLKTIAHLVAKRLLEGDRPSAVSCSGIRLINGLPPNQVDFWNLPVQTRFEQHRLDLFQQSLRECLCGAGASITFTV